MKRLEAEEAERKKKEAEDAEKLQKKAVGSPLNRKKEGENVDARTELEKAGGRVKKKRNTPPPTRSKGETKRRLSLIHI